jgi:hypothetical protein
MYSVVMVVAMAGAPEAPSCCCWKDFCCKSGGGYGKGCCDKNYGCAQAPVPVAPPPPPPPPVKVAPAPVAVAPAADCGYSKGCGGCCFFDKFKDCCSKFKGCFSGCCDKGYSSGCGGKGCGGCCDKGYSSGCGGAVVPPPPPPPVKDMPKVEKPKIGG